MTRDKAAKRAARNRAAETGESYTRARRSVETRREAAPEPAGQIATGPPDAPPGDQAQWWQAYQLAENDRTDELRQHAEAGDDHARRQLASWLSDRGRADEAITVIRPLADAGDDIAQLWLARWLSEHDEADELRRRARAGEPHARHHLAGWLAERGYLDELRALLADHRELLAASWEPAHGEHRLKVLRLRAELGDENAQRALTHWLTRMKERAREDPEP